MKIQKSGQCPTIRQSARWAIKRSILLAALTILLFASSALAQQLPGVDVFSPGLVRLSEEMAQSPAVHMEATLSAENAFLVRDLSLFSTLLDGASITYDGAMQAGEWADSLRIDRGGETLLRGAMSGDAVSVNGETFALTEQGALAADARAASLLEWIQGKAILERAPLEQVEAFLLSFAAGDELAGGYAIVQPFTSERTLSDDGTRLTRIQIAGSIARPGETPWVIKGSLKQPAGRAPKDTFDVTATQDEKNFFELTYSSLRQSEITKKNKSGKNNVDTHLNIAGKLGGYSVSERLTSYLRNTWTADGENLSEKIVVSMTLAHHDSTPGREKQNLNQAEAKMRHEIRLTTADAGNDIFDLTDGITVSLDMDGNTVLSAGADAKMTIGGAAVFVDMGEPAAEGKTLDEALETAAAEMARSFYGQMGDSAKKKVLQGLEE